MKNGKYLLISVVALLWLWLAYYALAPGVTLLKLFWVAISGIIVFVPLYKKYIRPH